MLLRRCEESLESDSDFGVAYRQCTHNKEDQFYAIWRARHFLAQLQLRRPSQSHLIGTSDIHVYLFPSPDRSSACPLPSPACVRARGSLPSSVRPFASRLLRALRKNKDTARARAFSLLGLANGRTATYGPA